MGTQYAELVLADGSRYKGRSFGFASPADGEVVFNTGMVGYPESLTDPSYKGQVLVLTYPLVGNYGVPADRNSKEVSRVFESGKIHLSGLIVSEYSEAYSHWNARQSLGDFLKKQKVPALTGVDTRELTKKLREHGVMLGRIEFSGSAEKNKDLRKERQNRQSSQFIDPNERDLVSEVTIENPVKYGKGGKKIIAIDCGMKNNIIHSLLRYDVTVLRVPAGYDISSETYDGLFISNGPGDPERNVNTIKNVRAALQKNIPTFGICLGNQIMALAGGARTYKLKYGHRSQNQPCLEKGTNRCYLTSQNHGYAVDAETLPKDWEPWFINANDGTVEGIRHASGRFFAVQFHPEACPGPVDTEWLFKKFIDLL